MEGYWRFHYEIGTIEGYGIAMLHDGDLVGADVEHVWTGTYKENGPALILRIRVRPAVCINDETADRPKPSILFLTGYHTKTFAALEGGVKRDTNLRIALTLRKCKGALADVASQSLGRRAA
jgi:hypothetical protein